MNVFQIMLHLIFINNLQDKYSLKLKDNFPMSFYLGRYFCCVPDVTFCSGHLKFIGTMIDNSKNRLGQLLVIWKPIDAFGDSVILDNNDIRY